jgi:hypothetical protein
MARGMRSSPERNSRPESAAKTAVTRFSLIFCAPIFTTSSNFGARWCRMAHNLRLSY